MSGFTKLVPEIVHSSIWNESSDIRVVWITMLAIKDAAGYVRGDACTLARAANVSVEACVLALEKFQLPDENSHTPDNEGRRIIPAPGGWMVLNADLYRGRDEKEQHRDYMRDYMRKYRNPKDKEVKDVNLNKPLPSASVSASESEGVQGEVSPDALALEAVRVFNPKAYYPPALIVSNICDLLRAHSVADIRAVFEAVKSKDWEYCPKRPDTMTDPGKFDGYICIVTGNNDAPKMKPINVK